MQIELKVNGKTRQADVPPHTLLVQLIRERLQLFPLQMPQALRGIDPVKQTRHRWPFDEADIPEIYPTLTKCQLEMTLLESTKADALPIPRPDRA